MSFLSQLHFLLLILISRILFTIYARSNCFKYFKRIFVYAFFIFTWYVANSSSLRCVYMWDYKRILCKHNICCCYRLNSNLKFSHHEIQFRILRFHFQWELHFETLRVIYRLNNVSFSLLHDKFLHSIVMYMKGNNERKKKVHIAMFGNFLFKFIPIALWWKYML